MGNQNHTMTKVDCLFMDWDGDGIEESIIATDNGKDLYLMVLKVNKEMWEVYEILKAKEEMTGLEEMLKPIKWEEPIKWELGKVYRVEELFGKKSVKFIELEGKCSTYGILDTENMRCRANLETVDYGTGELYEIGQIDDVYLLGERNYGDDPVITNLTLRVIPDQNKAPVDISLTPSEGYDPRIVIGKLTRRPLEDILVVVEQIEGGYSYYNIYSMMENEPKNILSSKEFGDEYTGKVTFEDYHSIKVDTDVMGKTYTMSIRDMPINYLNQIYDQDGNLYRPLEGELSYTSVLSRLDFDQNEEYDVSLIQNITDKGRDNILGFVETFLQWKPEAGKYVPYIQYVGQYGEAQNKEEVRS